MKAILIREHGGLDKLGVNTGTGVVFDTLYVRVASGDAARLRLALEAKKINLRFEGNGNGVVIAAPRVWTASGG